VPATAPPAQLAEELAEVTDATGSLVAALPVGFQTNTDPVTIAGVAMQHISGATDIETYLAGDFSIVGATVLAGPSAQADAPIDLLARFDPGARCTATDIERDAPTRNGPVTLLAYEQCGGQSYAMVLVAAHLDHLQQLVFVGVQAEGAADGTARDMAIAIFESIRRT
jgi:hypothetical protein